MGQTDAAGLTPKERRRFLRYRRMITRYPRTFRLFGRAHPAMFRLTGGWLGGTMQGTTIGLLTSTGRRSGRTRSVTVGYEDAATRFLVAASNFGLDKAPGWLLNLRAHPNAEFRTRAGAERVVARELTGPEREELWPRLLKQHPIWGACQSCTERQIAIIALERLDHQESA
jgi:F420H(2)-dependent quinone reductase